MVADGDQLTYEAARRVARESYSKLIAFLAKRTRDVAGAEDALSEAFPLHSLIGRTKAFLQIRKRG